MFESWEKVISFCGTSMEHGRDMLGVVTEEDAKKAAEEVVRMIEGPSSG